MTAAVLAVVLALVVGLLAGFMAGALGMATFLGWAYRWCDTDEWDSVGAALSDGAPAATVRGDA